MALKKFSEYISQSGKLQEKPAIEKVPDYDGEKQAKPPQGTGAKPYMAGTNAADPNKGKLKDGFADMGDDALEYNPVTSNSKDSSDSVEGIPGGKTVKSGWTNTQEWVDKTKNMPLAQFTKLLRNESLKGIDKEVAPLSSIKETVFVCKSNKNYVSALVREMKRNKLFGQLVNEMVQHPESFKLLANLMGKNESYARRLSMAMNEAVAEPIGMDQMGDEGEDEEIKLKHHQTQPDMGDDEDYGDDEDHDEDEEGDEDDEDEEDEDEEDEEDELDHDEDEEMHHHHPHHHHPHHHDEEQPPAPNAHTALSQMKDSPAMAAFMRSR